MVAFTDDKIQETGFYLNIQLCWCDFSMDDYLQTLTDSQQNHSRILDKINILVFGSVLVGTFLTFLLRHQDL